MRALMLGALLIGLPAIAGGHGGSFGGGGGFHGIGHMGGGGSGFARGWGSGGGQRFSAGQSFRGGSSFFNRGHGYFRPRYYNTYPYYYAPYLYTPWDYGDPTPYVVQPPVEPSQPAPPPAESEPPQPAPQPQMYGPPTNGTTLQRAQAPAAQPQSMGSRADITQDTGPGPDVYHWVDADGVDNYSTSVPPEARASATKVGIRLSGVVWTNPPSRSAASK